MYQVSKDPLDPDDVNSLRGALNIPPGRFPSESVGLGGFPHLVVSLPLVVSPLKWDEPVLPGTVESLVNAVLLAIRRTTRSGAMTYSQRSDNNVPGLWRAGGMQKKKRTVRTCIPVKVV